MKANGAPEKIYCTPTEGGFYLTTIKPELPFAEGVEYIQTDAFIEKADEFIGSFFHPDDTELRNCLLKKFHEYMKGEDYLQEEPKPKFKVGDLIKLSKEPKYPAREIISIKNDSYYFDSAIYLPFERQDDWELVEQKPADLKITAGNWYVCYIEVWNENMITAFHRGEVYYCPKDGYIDVNGMLFEVGDLDVFRLATKEEIPQPPFSI